MFLLYWGRVLVFYTIDSRFQYSNPPFKIILFLSLNSVKTFRKTWIFQYDIRTSCSGTHAEVGKDYLFTLKRSTRINETDMYDLVEGVTLGTAAYEVTQIFIPHYSDRSRRLSWQILIFKQKVIKRRQLKMTEPSSSFCFPVSGSVTKLNYLMPIIH